MKGKNEMLNKHDRLPTDRDVINDYQNRLDLYPRRLSDLHQEFLDDISHLIETAQPKTAQLFRKADIPEIQYILNECRRYIDLCQKRLDAYPERLHGLRNEFLRRIRPLVIVSPPTATTPIRQTDVLEVQNTINLYHEHLAMIQDLEHLDI